MAPCREARRGVGALVGTVLNVLTLLLLAHSRKREYAADERAAEATGKPVEERIDRLVAMAPRSGGSHYIGRLRP